MCINNKIDNINIAVVMNDDTVSYIKDIKNLYKSYNRLSGLTKRPKLKFPLLKVSKEEILNFLPDKYLNNVHVCEAPRFIYKLSEASYQVRECKSCAPCVRHLNLLKKHKK
jgi:hypothetical protein